MNARGVDHPPLDDDGPHELGELWRLEKRGAPARCWATTHPLGLELRLERNGVLVSTGVFREPEKLIAQSRVWKGLFEAKGWRAGGDATRTS